MSELWTTTFTFTYTLTLSIKNLECWKIVCFSLMWSLKGTSQYNSIPKMAAGFLPDCYFSRSVGRQPIFLTLNKVVNSPSGHLTIAAGRLFGRRTILSSNDQIFGRCPAGTPAIIRTPGSHRWESCRSPQDGNESRGPSAVHLRVTGRSPAGALLVCV